ncbi:MAG: 4Fe-4S binding protein [Bacteriovoracaceae bacterium]|nr:4Fe-4S binding protein [Bacteriovoracaceae bacterium]
MPLSPNCAVKFWRKISGLRLIGQIVFCAALWVPWLPHPEYLGDHLFWPVLLAGVLFCGFICPLGHIQEWLYFLGRKLKFPRFELPAFLQKYAQYTRYILAIVSFLGVSFSLLNARYYFHHNLAMGMLSQTISIILSIILLSSLFIARPFCNYFCLKGALDGALSIFRLISIRRDETKCTHCQLCRQACQMHIKVDEINFLRHPHCLNCLQCLKACPQGCLKYDVLRGWRDVWKNLPKIIHHHNRS